MAAITLDIGGNTRRLDRDIQKTVNKVYSINLKTKGDQPLGRITGKVNEFNKSLDASNARVIAFGASAGIIFGVQRAFSALVQSTIEVQKSLQDINVILNVSTQNLQKFGGELFNIARNTGQSFQEVAKAATEFSRQGLGVEETIKRTNEALILSRLSGLDAAKSVESLTAAVNSFASQAVTATEVVNKFATVDAAFAVSSADLADAIARVGSSAAQSGVSLNELIAIVTSAQQTTARGGAVIGNSFKTIFTRLQRGKVVDLLGTLGISDTNASGELKSTIQLLQDLGKVYDTLGARQQAAVAEQVGGVFQINILKAALADLGKEYSVYNSALNVAAGATDQAIRRNEELNKTYSAQINALQENARQLAAAGGERLLGPSIDRLVGGTNTLLKGFSEGDGQGVGAVLGKGILDGLGQFIAGPGIALIGGVLLKLFRDLGKFAAGSFRELLGLNTAATQQRDLQQSINQILAKNPQLLELALKGEQGLNVAANSLLASLQKQTVELQKQAAVAAQISKALISQAGARVTGGVPVVPTPKTGRPGKAAGYIPNFAEEDQAKEFGAKSNVKAVRGVGKIGGKRFEANNQEFQLKNFAGTGETAVIPKYGNGIKEATKMIARGESGSILNKKDRKKKRARGFYRSKNRWSGFIPNFANLDTIANLKAKASRSGGLLGNLYDIGEDNFFDKYQKPAIKRVPLQKNVSQYTKVADAFIRDARKRASSDPNSIGSIFNNLRYKGTPISQFTDKIKPDTLLDPKKDLKNNINIKGALGEIDSQKRFGSGGRKAEKQGDLFGADFLVKKQGSSYLVESKVTQRKVPDNILIAKALQYEGQITGGKYKKNDINDEIKLKNIILSYAPFKNAASGFIPNFAPIKFPSAGYSADSEQARKDLLRQDYRKNILESYRRSNIKSFRGKNFKQERETAVREAQMNREVYKQVKGVAGGAISTFVYHKNRPGDSPGKMVVTEELEGLNVREVRDHEYTGTESNALTIENGKVVLEDYNPKSSKRFPFKAKYRKKINELAGALKMPVIERSALTKQLATSRIAAIRNDRSGIYQNSRYEEDDDGFASGFIPNFAKETQAVNLDGISTNRSYSTKLVSAIIPQPTNQLLKFPAQAEYRGTLYRTNDLPVSGPNRDVTKKLSQQNIPNLNRNIGKVIVDQANVFGQSLGATKFMNSASELPNLGGVNSAVGVAFEGGVANALGQSVGSKNARVDFSSPSLNPKIKKIFNNAPGSYEAKYRPSTPLINDVFSKFLSRLKPTKPGEIKAASSGAAGKAYLAARSAEVAKIREQFKAKKGREPYSKEINKELALRGIPSRAAGFIPNFAGFSFKDGNLAPIVRATDDKELKLMFSQFSRGLPFQHMSYDTGAAMYNPPLTPGGPAKGMYGFASSEPGYLEKNQKAAFKQNLLRGKNWSTSRPNSRWLVKYDRNKLDENEVLQDPESRGASIYGKAVNKNQIIWPIKEAIGSGRIFEKDIPAFLSGKFDEKTKGKMGKNFAAGFIPNFGVYERIIKKGQFRRRGQEDDAIEAAKKREISRMGSAVTLPSKRLRSPVVVNKSQIAKYGPNADKIIKKDHIDRGQVGTKSNLMKTGSGREKYSSRKASGFIPNFAIEDPDVQGVDAATGITAIAAQITSIGFAFAFTGNQFKDSLKELTAANQKAGQVQREISDKQKKAILDEEKQLRGRRGAKGRADERIQQEQFAPGFFGKGKGSIGSARAFLGANALGLSIAAPILGETLKNIAGQETTTQRGFGALGSSIGQIGSFAATGALIAPGPIGAGVGAAIGALLTIPTVVNEFTSELPELTAAARKSSQELTKFSDVSSRILTAFTKVTELSSGGGSPKALLKAQEELNKSLGDLSLSEKDRVSNALKLGTLEEELAKIIEERIKNEKNALQRVALQTIADSSRFGFSGLGTFETSSKKGKEDAKTIQEIFRQSFTKGRTDQESLEVVTTARSEGLPALQNLLKGLQRGQLFGGREGIRIQEAGLPVFKEALQSLLPDSETKADDIEGLVGIAGKNLDSFISLLLLLIESLGKAPEEIQKNIKLFEEGKKAADDLAKAQKEYAQNTDNLVSSLSRSISVLNNFINTLARFENTEKNFSRENAIGQTFTTPRTIAETVLGSDADLTRQLALFEQIAKNENERLTSIEASNQQFKEDFRGNLDTAFSERLAEIQNLKGSESGNQTELKESERQIKEASALLRSGAVKISDDVLNKSFIDGKINPDKLQSDLKAAFEKAGLSGGESQKILDSIYKSAINQQNSLLETNQLAAQQNLRAATELTNQKILKSLNQSLNVFGGVDKFLTPPEEGIVKPLETLIKSATGQLKTQRGFEFARRTGAGTSFGTEEQIGNNIDLGQSSLAFIKQLQDLSGGAFAPDPGSELYRRASAGLAQSFENNIKQLNDLLKDPTVDKSFKSQIEATLEAIGGLGSSRDVAQLQIAKETGTAFQSTLVGAFSRLQDPAIQQLEEAGLGDLAKSVAENAQFTADPIVNVLNVQKTIQTEMSIQLEAIRGLLNTIKNQSGEDQPKEGGPQKDGSTPGRADIITTKAKGLIPAFNKESRAISRGVGGAKAGDRPQFIPNLNGAPAFVNSGEQLVDNYMGSRQTAVLTRDMQKGMAKGFIPNFAPDPEEKNGSFGRNIGFEDFSSFLIENITTLAKAGKFDITEIFTSGGLGVLADSGSQYSLDLIRGGQSSENPYIEAIEKFISRGLGGAAGGAISTRTPQGAIIGAMTDLVSGAVFDLSTFGGLSWDLILQNIENSKAGENIKKLEEQLKLKQNLRKSGNFSAKKKSKYTAKETPESLKKLKQDLESQRSRPKNFASGFIPNLAENENVAKNFMRYRYSSNPAVMGYMMAEGIDSLFPKDNSSNKSNKIGGLSTSLSDLAFKLGVKKNKKVTSSAKGFIPNFAPQSSEQMVDPNEFPETGSFKTIRAEVVQDLDDTEGKKYIVIRSKTPLNEDFHKGKEISFGKDKKKGKIISVDPNDSFLARVQVLPDSKAQFPRRGDKFSSSLEGKEKQELTEEQTKQRLEKYREMYARAEDYAKPGNIQETPADAADILNRLQRGFSFNSKNYSNLDNNPEYQDIKERVQLLRDRIRETNPRPKTRDEVISEAIVDSTMEPIGARAINLDPVSPQLETISSNTIKPQTVDQVLKDAAMRAALLNERTGRLFGINTGTKSPTGLDIKRKKPTTTSPRAETYLAETYPGNQPGSSVIDFYRDPDIGLFMNEITHFQQFGSTKKEREEKVKKYSEKYIENLKKLADFIEEQNKKNPFVSIQRYNGNTPFDDSRVFNKTISEFGTDVSEFDYIEERASTLQDALFKGISTGAIDAKSLESYGLTPEVSQFIVAETKALEEQLRTKTYQQRSERPGTAKKLPPPKTPPTVPKTSTPPPPEPLPGIQPAVQDTTPTITPKKPRKTPTAAPIIAEPEIPRPTTRYPGGISPETARAIVEELDATYNDAIQNQKNPQTAKAWAQTQQRYRLLYSRGQYAELDRFYKGLQKDYQRRIGQNPNKNQNQTNFAAGFIPHFAPPWYRSRTSSGVKPISKSYNDSLARAQIQSRRNPNSNWIPNFAQDYISNLANLESGLSGEKAKLTNIPGIGLAMINEGQAPGKFPYKDHPEGKMAAIKNSMKMQKSMGVMSKGYIPNFAATDQSFAQQEAAFNSNTSALTTLAGGIDSLNSTISNFQSNFANLNNAPTMQSAAGTTQAGGQPNVTTTTNAPVNVVVNAQGGNDIAAAVGTAVENAIPIIIDKVKVALGQKVPPRAGGVNLNG